MSLTVDRVVSETMIGVESRETRERGCEEEMIKRKSE